MQVEVTSDDIPLSLRCLTATIVQTRPSFDLDPTLPNNDVATVCLGERPKALLSGGEFPLFDFYPCVGVTSEPCTSADTLELFATTGSPELVPVLPPDSFIVEVPRGEDFLVLPPDSFVVRVNDITLRSGAWVWSTASEFELKDSQARLPGTVWSSAREDITVTGPDGGPPPGSFTWNWVSTQIPDIHLTDTTKSIGTTIGTGYDTGVDLDFGSLGTYLLTVDIRATHQDSGLLTAMGTYTFNVGPVADLEVREGEVVGSPLAAASERAYTIVARNHGPDVSQAVQVALSGVPEGARVVFTAGEKLERDGDFRWGTCTAGLCEAVWDLGAMGVTGDNLPRGRRTAFPTLTLIAPAGAPADDITATIANTEDYSVCIDSGGEDVAVDPFDEATCTGAGHSWHSTPYYDHHEANNRATIPARPGTNDGLPPGTPRGVKVQLYPGAGQQPDLALVQWDPVERLNLWPVTHYEVWRPAAGCHAPGEADRGTKVEAVHHLDREINLDEPVCYYVRAVNEFDVVGFWSEPGRAATGLRSTPQLSVRGGPAVVEGEDASFTISAFPAPVAGETLTVNYTVSQQGDFVDASNLGRKQATMTDSGELRIPVQTVNDEADEANGSVTVTLNGGSGYTLSSARSATVPVMDNETVQVSFLPNQTSATVKESDGPHDVTVAISPAPAADLTIDYTIEYPLDREDSAEEGKDFRIAGLSGGSGSVTARPGQNRVNIPVQVINDGDSEASERFTLVLEDGDDYGVSSPDRYTLTIEDDDGVGVRFATATSRVGEADGSSAVTINLNPAPTADTDIHYTVSGVARAGDDYNIAGLTGNAGTVTARANASSVDIPVDIIDDQANEGDEELALTLQRSGDYNIAGGRQTHTLTILDNNRPRASFATASYDCNENVAGLQGCFESDAGPHNVTINLDPVPTEQLTLRYRVDGASTATRGRDYTISNYGTVPVPANTSSVNIPVTIIDDMESEPAETVILTLEAGPNYTVGAAPHMLTIQASDLPVVTFAQGDASVREVAATHPAVISVDPRPYEDITVRYTVSGDATDGADYTIAGLTGNSGTVTVRRGQNRAVIPIAIKDDRAAEDLETVILTLDNPGDGVGYDLDSDATSRFTLTIEDNDAATASFQKAAGSVCERGVCEASVAEDGGGYTVTVQLNQTLDAPVTINYTTRGRATRGEDYTITGYGSVEVPAGSRSADITVSITDDTDYEGYEMVVLTLAEGLYNVGTRDRYLLTIVDDEEPPEDARVVSFSNFAAHNSGDPRGCERNEGQGGCRPAFFTYGGDLPNPLDVVIKLVADSTATLNEDFEFSGGPAGVGETFTVTVPANSAGQISSAPADATVAWIEGLSPIDDGRSEGRETVIFRLVNGPGYRVEGVTEFTLTILD